MANLADYLDELAVRPDRGFGTVPSLPLILPSTLPFVIPSGAVASILDIYSSADKARVDSQMWSLDARWTGSAQWADMRTCVVPRGDVAGGIVTTALRDLGAAGCRTSTGAPADLTCNWGFWRIDRCDLDTASTQVFQFGRYLWAQARMRELLANKPVPGRVNDGPAAAWAWQAAQLISAMWWSTNVRFDNPNAAYVAGDYTRNLRTAGLLPPLLPGGPGTNHWGGPADNNLGFAYDGPPLASAPYFAAYPLGPRNLNSPGYRAYAPTRQNDFSPGTGPLGFMDRTAPPPTGTVFAVNGIPYYGFRSSPIGLSAEQTEEVRRLAYSYYTASGDIDALRWASMKAFNDYWFRITWSWPTLWQPVPNVTGRGKPLVLGGARLIIEDLARQLAFYSQPSKSYIAWMQSAMMTYNSDTSGVTSDTPAGSSFNDAKFRLITSINQAATQYEAASRSGTSGTDSTAATITTMAASLVQAVWSLVGQSVPILGLIFSLLQQIANLIFAAVGGAIGNVPCPAFPFIRVMSPRSGVCDLTTADITSSLLGIASNARWPVQIGGQTRSFAVDGKAFSVTFASTDTTADLVARRINAAAALAALGSVASVRSGQVHVEGRDPSQGTPRATGGTACSLGFPGPCTTSSGTSPGPTMATCPGGVSVPAGTPCPPPAPAKSSAIPWFVAAAVAARLLLG